jgi:hypothetical protein
MSEDLQFDYAPKIQFEGKCKVPYASAKWYFESRNC